MKKTFVQLKTMLLRPAYYNGEQFEADIIFNGADLDGETPTIMKALDMPFGDTAKIRGKLKRETESRKFGDYINIYISGDMLEDFIKRFGVEDVEATLTLKLELVYAVFQDNDCLSDPYDSEVIGFKLLGIC